MTFRTSNSFNTSEQKDNFSEFFEMGMQETVSPFISPESRMWGANLTLKAAILAAILLLTSFILSFFPSTIPISHIFLLGVYFLAGIPSLIESIQDLLDGDINIDILMTVAAFSSVFIGSGMEGALLLVLFALSGSMEDAVTAKAKGAISSLNKLSPTRACVIENDGKLIERALSEVPVGTHILVKANQIVPLDGVVIEGTSSVNLVHLTGENLPVTKKVGDEVPAGGRNLEGALTLQVMRSSADSTLAKIIQLVTQAQEARPTLQRWFDRLSRSYAFTIMLLAALVALSFPFLLKIPFFGHEGSIYRGLAFLIAASPCALIIAIPIAYLSAISSCAKKGIVLKGGITLDALAKCKAIAFDKTGTLTTGELALVSIEPLSNLTITEQEKQRVLEIAYALEKNAVHPIANALVKYAQEREIFAAPLVDFKAVPGYGLEAKTKEGSKKVFIGKQEYIAQQLEKNTRDLLQQKIKNLEEKGEIQAILLIDADIYILHFVDTPREHIKETLHAIRQRGMATVMLTGDNPSSAQRIADHLEISEYHANLTPEQKLEYVSSIADTKGLAMIGDGVNDAPALARSTVGVCMGKIGSTAAIDASDVILLHDNIEVLDWLIGKAKKTQQIVKQNLIIASSAILIASLPALGGLIPLWLAVILHEGGTVLVGLNALRLLRK